MRNNVIDNDVMNRNKNFYKYALGNYITIRHDNKLYSTIGHLKYESINLKIGDFVKCGEYIGLSENLGNSKFPHIHFQVQNKESLFLAKSLPIIFSNTYVK